MKILSLEAENVKRLRAVHITPATDGGLVIIGGNNGNGKTSVLDSIQMALGGTAAAPERPVRAGEDRAVIVADMGDMIVKRTFTAAGGTSLVVTNKDGLKYPSPQGLLDGMMGKLSFDPLAFTRLEGKSQVETLRRLVGLDFTKIDAERKALYDKRTVINAQQRTAESRVASMPQHDGITAENAGSLTELNNSLAEANAHNNNIVVRRNDLDALETKAADAANYIAKCDAAIADLEKRLADAQAKRAQGIQNQAEIAERLKAKRDEVAGLKPISTEAIVTEMQVVQLRQKKLAENQARDKAVAESLEFKRQSQELTAMIEKLDTEKAEQLAAAKFPVPGLSFSDTGVVFNGLPLEQASGAEKIRVSVAIGAALNPKVRVILVRDGSLLDDQGLALLGELADAHQLQVWVERVGKGAECSVILEDGAIVAPAAPKAEEASIPHE